MKLAGSSVLITGASRGLGLAVGRLLAQRGARLALTARGGAALHRAAGELAHETEVFERPGDVADRTHLAALVEGTTQRFGRIDILINNASVVGPTPMPQLADYPPDALDYVFRVNTLAPLYLAQRVLPGMRRQGRGLIINVTSDAGTEAYPGWGGYGASKAALELASRVLAAELGPTGIRVYVVDPGEMNTQMHREAEPGVDLSHLASPDEVAPAFVHLLEAEPPELLRVRAQDLLVVR